jgi:hypothetical protein
MSKSQNDKAYDHEILMQMVLELTQAAIEAGEMTDEVVELVCDLERELGNKLGFNPANSPF